MSIGLPLIHSLSFSLYKYEFLRAGLESPWKGKYSELEIDG